MKSTKYLLAVACMLATGSLFIPALPATADDVVTGKTAISVDDKGMKHTTTLVFPDGIQQKDLKALGPIEKSLTNLAEDAISRNGFDNLIGYLVVQDKDRIGAKKNMNVDDLNALADKINGTWKAKYGQNFKADKKTFDNYLTVLTGEVTNPDLLVGKWPVDAGPMPKSMDSTSADMGSGKLTQADADQAKKTFGGEVKLEKGRNVAVAFFPASHDLPGITASLIHEVTGWRFDIPNNIDADHLHANLKNALTILATKNDWPSDFFEAQREATHAIVGSLYGVDLYAGGSMKTANEK